MPERRSGRCQQLLLAMGLMMMLGGSPKPAPVLASSPGGEEIVPVVEVSGAIEVTPENWHLVLPLPELAEGALPEGTVISLAPGHYHLTPRAHIDATCGNCEDPHSPVSATVGLVVSGHRIHIQGAGQQPEDVVIHTHAGYGLLFRDGENCVLRNMTVTDGIRDPDPNATDAAIVVQRSQVTIEGCLIRDNLGDASVVAKTVVGVMGIAGREGAVVRIRDCRILRNSWDGIALFRGATAEISDNIIDGVDKATGDQIGGGRGVGIGVTWNARADIRRNLVTRYWKGIGIFVDGRADIERNVVEDIITWGIAYWDAGRGRPVARIVENVVYQTGACGIAITRAAAGDPEPGECRGNLVVRSGQNPKYDAPDHYCYQCPLAIHAQPPEFTVADNLSWDNRRAGDCPDGGDLTANTFRQQAMQLLKLLQTYPALKAGNCFQALEVPGASALYR